MSVLITSPSETLAKIRWHEQYVSEGLNKKLNGITPAGVVRGGRLVENLAVDLTVKILADTLKGDSIYSFIDANGHQITFRQAGDVVLDLTPAASTTVFIGLLVTFAVSSTTTVQWRAYSQAEIDADPTIVVLGKVVVPAAGAIPAANITPTERRDAWYDDSPGMRPWHQVIRNGSFEVAADGAITNSDEDEFPGWRTASVSATGPDLSIDTTQYLTGRRSLKVSCNGNTSYTYLIQETTVACRPGDRIRASMWLKWDTVSVGGIGDLCLYLTFYTHEALGAGTAVLCQAGAEDGTSLAAWTEFDEITEAPAGAYFVRASIRARDAGGAATGDYYIDDVRMWVEAGQASNDDISERGLVGQSPPFSSLDIMPRGLATTDMADWISKLLRLRFGGFSSPVYEYEWKHRLGSLPWLLKMIGGGVQIDRLIEGLGSSLIGSDADAANPRVEAPFRSSATAYTLMFQFTQQGTKGSVRVYATYQSNPSGNFEGIVVTVNAFWNTGTSLWNRDQNTRDSTRLDITATALKFYFYDDALADTWADADWASVGQTAFFVQGSPSAPFAQIPSSGSYTFDANKEGNLIIIPGGAFHPSIGQNTTKVPDWDRFNTVRRLYTVGDDAGGIVALPYIPSGAEIEEIRLWLHTPASSDVFTLQLRYLTFTDGGGVESDTLVSGASNPGALGYDEIKITGIGHTVSKAVAATMRAYYLRVLLTGTHDDNSSIQGALVRYYNNRVYV